MVSKFTSNFWNVFDLVEMISSVPSSVIRKISLISSMDRGSEKIFLSVYGISCSSNHDFAFLHDVQLGEVYSVTIRSSHSSLIYIIVILYSHVPIFIVEETLFVIKIIINK